ncbi:MAG: twin-arginine translocase subunit TatC [Gemmatimonadetes bacterium]|nr:twin-arginine translocase subunit TatC [Gemmatimonadota bacterium]
MVKYRRARRPTDEMPFLDHLEELRWRLLWSLLALAVCAIIGFVVVMKLDVLGLLIDPIRPFLEGEKPKFLSPTDPFFLTLKLGLVLGIILASPIVIYQTWAFISPALLVHEKRSIVPALYLGVLLFAAGAALAYFVALPVALRFLLSFQVESLEQNIVVGPYLGFVVRLLLGFGVVFELPVVVLVLSMLGLVKASTLAAKRRYALVIITIVAAVMTPGDVVVLTVFMMVPLLLLYELSIGLARLVERRRARRELADLGGAPVGAA